MPWPAREQRLAASIVYVGAGIRLEDRIGRSDRCDCAAVHRQRHIVLHRIDGDDGGVGNDDGPARGSLGLRAGLVRLYALSKIWRTVVSSSGAENSLPSTRSGRASPSMASVLE